MSTKVVEAHGSRKCIQSDGGQSFLRAARSGNLTKVVDLLNAGINIDSTNANGLTALHLASKEGQVDVVRELLKRGASVKLVTKKGNTALHIASLAGHFDVVKLLIEHGADVNAQSQNGFTPLYMAAQENHVEVVNHLLNNGANSTLSTEDGFTPLAVALQQGHDRVVAILLEKDSRGKTRLPALHVAAKKNDVHSATLLLNNSDVNVDHSSASGFTPLHIAAHYGNLNMTKLLIERGANVNFNAKNSITPLHVAAKWGKNDVACELLKAGADVDARTRDGLTPLHCAARSGHADVVETLLKAGANASLKTKNDLSPLHMTAQGDHEQAARILLLTGANPDAVTVDYLTPLHVAAHCGNVNVARVLLESKCNVNARALNGFTALHIASKKSKIPLVELLLKNGSLLEAATETGLTPLHVASFVGCTDAVSLLLQHGANVNQTTLRNETPLHLVARNKQVETAKVLLNHGAQLDARTRDNQTPLHVAIRSKYLPMVKLLLDAGSDITATTRDSYSALHLATKENSEEIVTALLEHGAKSDQKTKKGFTPLHLAAKHGSLSIAQTLLEQAHADPNATGRSGFSPVHVAAYYNQSPVLQLLAQHGGDVNKPVKNGFTPLHLAAKRNNLDCAELLASQGANVDVGSRNGYTPLHLASQDGQVEIVRLLIDKCKASPDMAALDGLTPLHLAVQEDKVLVAECLLNAGAPVDAVTTEAGFNPLHTAAYRGQLASVRLLLNRLAETGKPEAVNSRTRMGSTPLHLAAQQGHLQVVLKLLQSGADPNARNRQGWTAAQLAYKQHYLNLFEVLKEVTTNVTDWSVPSLTGAGPDGLTDGDPNLVTGSIALEKVEHMIDHVISDSDEEGGELIPTPSLLRRRQRPKQSVDQQEPASDDRWSRTSSYDLICQQLEYMKNHTDVTDETALPSTPRLSVGPGFVRPSYLFLSEHQSKRDEPARTSIYDTIADERPKSYLSDQVGSEIVTPQKTSVQGVTAPSPSAISDWEFYAENIQLLRKPIKSGFLISFLVDARGCLVEAQRRADLRFFIPPNATSEPIRIICRVLRPEFAPNQPNLNDGDCLAARILEMGPCQAQFSVPILIEVPHIASLRGREREVIVLRSETGNTWKEHQMEATDQAVHDALGDVFDRVEPSNLLRERRIHRILTCDFPQYFALLSRFRQEIALVGSEGGLMSSTVCPQVQAVFPPGALQKKIKVGLQAQPISRELVTRIAGPRVSVSPVVSIEPRRRKFHKPITLTIPLPRPPPKVEPGATPNIRLLCSLSGGTNPAVWEDITGSTPLTRHKDCISFTTTVSARLWLIDCPNSAASVEIATQIYRESIVPPIVGRFALYTRQPMTLDAVTMTMNGDTASSDPTHGLPRLRQPCMEQAQIRCLCLTDDNEDKTLECLERFGLVAIGQPSELLENRPCWIEMTGNLVPITKADSQPRIVVRPFRDNRVTFPVRVQTDALDTETDPAMVSAKVFFMRDPRHTVRAPEDISPPQRPITTLEIQIPRPGRSMLIVTADTEILGRSELDRFKVARQLSSDWEKLAVALDFTPEELDNIRHAHSATGPMSDQEKANLMLGLWQQKSIDGGLTEKDALGNRLANALNAIHRSDVIHPSMTEVRPVWTEDERTLASTVLNGKVALPRVEEEPFEREAVELLKPQFVTPVPEISVSEKPVVVDVDTTQPVKTEVVVGKLAEEHVVSSTDKEVSSISASEAEKPVGISEAIILSSETTIPKPVTPTVSSAVVDMPPGQWETEFMEHLEREKIPMEPRAPEIFTTTTEEVEIHTPKTVEVIHPEPQLEPSVDIPRVSDEVVRLPEHEVSEVTSEVTIATTELVQPQPHDMHVAHDVLERFDTVPAIIPGSPATTPESSELIPVKATDITETGVPQLIQSRLEEEDEIKETLPTIVKTELPQQAEPLSAEPDKDWKEQLLMHLEDSGIPLEPTPQVPTSVEPEQQLPDDQLQPTIHIRQPGFVSEVQAESIRQPVVDRETRLAAAQELAEIVVDEAVVAPPILQPMVSVEEEVVEPVAVDHRLVQLPTMVQADLTSFVEPLDLEVSAVPEKLIETQIDQEVETVQPEEVVWQPEISFHPAEVVPETEDLKHSPQLEPTTTPYLEEEFRPEVPVTTEEGLVISEIEAREAAAPEEAVKAPDYPWVKEISAGVWPDDKLLVYTGDEELELPPEQSDEEGFEQVYHEAALMEGIQIPEKEPPIIAVPPSEEMLESPVKPDMDMELPTAVIFPPGSAGHDVVQSSPEESQEFEEVEEVLPDGTLVKSRMATTETVQSVSCRNWQEGVDAAIESGAYTVEEPEETTQVEQVEEVLPDGTVITRLVTTKHIIDRVTEHALSEEVIQPEDMSTIASQQETELDEARETGGDA